eukprot:s699_g21.t2
MLADFYRLAACMCGPQALSPESFDTAEVVGSAAGFGSIRWGARFTSCLHRSHRLPRSWQAVLGLAALCRLLHHSLHRNILAARCELSSNLMTQRYRSMKVDELATQHPASTLCDFAKTELSSHLLLAGMATAATARLHELSAQDPAKACWEPVTVKLTSPEVQLLVADAVSVRLPCDAPSLASLARSAALLLAKDAALSGMLASAATSILDECSASNPADSA